MSENRTPSAGGSLRHRLYNGETNWEFVSRWKKWFLFSAAIIAIGLASLGLRGLTLGLDFKGGTVWEVPLRAQDISVERARDLVRPFGLSTAKIQTVRNDADERAVRITGEESTADVRDRVADTLAKEAKVPRDEVLVDFVGPSWGKDVTAKAQRALVAFFILITLYISLRFEWKMALAALAAVVHDILVTVGIYSLSGFEVTPATVVAFLTILGYSLYDTIVVFDKVEENVKQFGASGKYTYSDLVNLSMNQTLMRSVNTSLVAILPILSLLVVGAGFLGASALGDFGLALFIGLLTGAYSSIFIASPLLALLKERETRFRQIRERLHARAGGPALSPLTARAASAAPGLASVADGGAATLRPADVAASGTGAPGERPVIVPRARKQGKTR